MAEIKFANNAISVLNGALAIGGTTINVAPGEGAKFPTLAAGDWFYATLEEASPASPAFPLREIVKVTARTSDALTVTRGQDGTTARAWLSGDKIELRWTAATVADLRAEIAALDSALAALKVSKAGDAMTGNLDVPSLNGGSLAGLRNLIINGGFSVNQRGTQFTTPQKTSDMWAMSWDGASYSRQADVLYHSAGSEIEGCENYLRIVQSLTGTSTWFSLEHVMEDVKQFGGGTYTLSFWAKADTNRSLSFFTRQRFGTGGSTQVDSNNTTFNLTATWQKFTFTLTVPSHSGKTIGANNSLVLVWLMPLVNSATFYFSTMQFERGPLATPFERRPIGLEYALCQRYFYAVRGNATTALQFFGFGWQTSTTNTRILVELPQTMRGGVGFVDGGGVSLWGPSTGSAPPTLNPEGAIYAADNGVSYPTKRVVVDFTHNALGAIGYPMMAYMYNGYIGFSSEL